jgi:hypothetical protein
MLDIKVAHDLGSLRADAAKLERDTARVIAETGSWLQGELRQQVDAAGLGRGVARAWRLRLYRNRDGNAALVYSKTPNIVHAFEFGVTIRARSGRYLAIPTGFNRKGGRRGAAVLVTPAMMMVRGVSFATRSKRGRLLWWYRIERSSRLRRTTKGGQPRLHRTGVVDAGINGRIIRDRKRREMAVKYGAVPMFVLVRDVKLRKRLDIRGAATRALDRAAAEINSETLN